MLKISYVVVQYHIVNQSFTPTQFKMFNMTLYLEFLLRIEVNSDFHIHCTRGLNL